MVENQAEFRYGCNQSSSLTRRSNRTFLDRRLREEGSTRFRAKLWYIQSCDLRTRHTWLKHTWTGARFEITAPHPTQPNMWHWWVLRFIRWVVSNLRSFSPLWTLAAHFTSCSHVLLVRGCKNSHTSDAPPCSSCVFDGSDLFIGLESC